MFHGNQGVVLVCNSMVLFVKIMLKCNWGNFVLVRVWDFRACRYAVWTVYVWNWFNG